MSYEILLWKPREGSRRSRAFVYFVLSESATCDGVAPLDVAAFESAMRAAHPDGYTVQVSPSSVRVRLDETKNWSAALDALRRVAADQGLELFDAQAETTSEREKRAARAYVDALPKKT